MSIKLRPCFKIRSQQEELRKRRKMQPDRRHFKIIPTPSASVAPSNRRVRTTWTSIWHLQWIIWAMNPTSFTEKLQKNKSSELGLIRGLATWRLGSWQESSLNRVMICDWNNLLCNSYRSWTLSSKERRFNCGWSLTKSWQLHISVVWLSSVMTLSVSISSERPCQKWWTVHVTSTTTSAKTLDHPRKKAAKRKATRRHSELLLTPWPPTHSSATFCRSKTDTTPTCLSTRRGTWFTLTLASCWLMLRVVV